MRSAAAFGQICSSKMESTIKFEEFALYPAKPAAEFGRGARTEAYLH